MNVAEAIFDHIDEIQATLRIDEPKGDKKQPKRWSEGALEIVGLKGAETLSGLFEYDVTVRSDAETAEGLDDALGRDVSFVLKRVGGASSAAHIVHGMVEEIYPGGFAIGDIGKKRRETTLRIKPRLTELCHTQQCRVFQDQTVVQIAKELIAEWMHVDDRTSHMLEREYCTQMNESDYDFLRRILSEEGIHFRFEHDEQGAKLVLVDHPGGYRPRQGEELLVLPYNDAKGAVTTDHVRSIRRERRVRPGSVAYRDYNFLKPTILAADPADPTKPGKPAPFNMTARASGPVDVDANNNMGNRIERELYEYPGHYNAPDFPSVVFPFNTEVEKGTRDGADRAQIRLEEQRSDALTFSGTTTCLGLRAGQVFKIDRHPDKFFNRHYTVTKIELSSETFSRANRTAGENLTIAFRAVPSEVPIRPPVISKPKAHLRTARVVGPKEDEPNVDDYGRIKIQFAWERKDTFDENSSCWVRMATPVAHFDQGTYIAHRVGAEVLVDFLDGDIDRPIVIAAVFNADNRQPQKLASDATRAVLYRGLSVPGNGGKNEISCEDRAGNEEIYIHAQKDLNERILSCHSESIGKNQSSSVGVNQSVTVGKDQTVTVGKNQTITVKGGDRKVLVTSGNETTNIQQKRTETVQGGESVLVFNGRKHTVQSGNDEVVVSGGNRVVKIHATHDIFSNARKEDVTTTVDVKAGTSVHLHHGGDSHLTLEGSNAHLTARGGARVSGGRVARIEAGEEILLVCGSASLSLKSDGTIAVSGSKAIGLVCGGAKLDLAPTKASMSAAGISVKADGIATFNGALVRVG